MRIVRGFPNQDVVAGYSEATGGGDVENFNAARNAPAKSPLQHLDKVAFHSDFYLYERVHDQLVTVVHPAIAGGPVVGRVGWWSSTLDVLVFEPRGQITKVRQLLLAHGLGYTPLCMVALNGAMVVAGTLVQNEVAGARFVGVHADNTHIALSVGGYSGNTDLPAISRTYRVIVFRTAAPNPADPLFSGGPSQMQLGRGVINSDKRYFRRDTAAGALAMDTGRTMDIEAGGARVVTGGIAQTDQYYDGTFAGSPFIPVGF